MTPQDSEHDEESTNLRSIFFRRQQLQNRLQFLQEIQKRNNRIEGYLANEEGPSELDRIEEELKVLEQKEKDLIQKNSQCSTTQPTDNDPLQLQVQGLYVLPIGLHEDQTVSPAEAINPIALPEEKTETISPIVPLKEHKTVNLDDVTMSPAKVKCPSCCEIVTTEIHYKVGSNSFLFCCLLSVVGCLAGCCLIPFCISRFKDVVHKCPSCHKQICAVHRL